MRGLLVNDLPKYIVIILWLGANAALFVMAWRKYSGVTYYYTRIVLGPSVLVSRGAAACLNLNCMLVLLPVCRNMLSLLRGWMTCCPRRVKRILDKNIAFHKLCAYMIVFMTMLHYYGHCFNVQLFSNSHLSKLRATDSPEEQLRSKLRGRLASMGSKDGESFVDPIRKHIPFGAAFFVTGGWTGVVITACLFLIVTSSTEFIRRSYFEVFWYTHHLFIVFYGFLVVHGVSRQLRGQNNLDEHDPLYCSTIDCDDWRYDPKCSTMPQFEGTAPETWMWVVGPIALYLIERVVRLVRFSQPVEILKVVKHPSRVIELQMRKKGFRPEVGQYVFIQCPKLSFLEWHPFTLTSAPEENYFSVHIRVVGDWTTGLSTAVGAKESAQELKVQPSWKMPRIAVDGPFGTASEDVFAYEVALCVGSGIGVTPFASMLKSVYYRNVQKSDTERLKKVYFFWICPDTHAFEWFGDMLIHLEQQLLETGQMDLIEYNIYLTRGWNASQARAIFIHDEDETDIITGLEQKTNYGRPNWDDIFTKISNAHAGKEVGVFFCGVAALSATLHKMCNRYSSGKVSFHYNKENF